MDRGSAVSGAPVLLLSHPWFYGDVYEMTKREQRLWEIWLGINLLINLAIILGIIEGIWIVLGLLVWISVATFMGRQFYISKWGKRLPKRPQK